MPTRPERTTPGLTSLLLLNARVHCAGAVAYFVATRGQAAPLCGYEPQPFELAAWDFFRLTIDLLLHAPSIMGPIGRLDDAIGRIPGPLGDWLRVALLLWVDVQLWAIIAALACGLWRRWSRRREAVL